MSSPATNHRFVFEAWPPDATERTLPSRTGEHWATIPSAARAAAVAELAATHPGWTVGAGIHNRGLCQPAHPGRN